jgi:hypothetical protein
MPRSCSTRLDVLNDDLTKMYDRGSLDGDDSAVLNWIVMKRRKNAKCIHLAQDSPLPGFCEEC